MRSDKSPEKNKKCISLCSAQYILKKYFCFLLYKWQQVQIYSVKSIGAQHRVILIGYQRHGSLVLLAVDIDAEVLVTLKPCGP